MLILDARREAPTVALTLTTVQPWQQLDDERYRRGCAEIWRRLRRRFGRAEYIGLQEFTTGRAKRSGGHRRMHAHHLVKGVPPDDVLGAEKIVRGVWEPLMGAWRVELAALLSPGAAIGYLGLHHRKPEQAVPAGWKGRRVRTSQGYWSEPVDQLREAAKRAQAMRRIAWKLAREMPDASPEFIALAASTTADEQRAWWARQDVRLVREGRVLTPLGLLEPPGHFGYRAGCFIDLTTGEVLPDPRRHRTTRM